jgi:hypothetical protein
MKTKTSLLLASIFSAIALFSFVPAHAEDEAGANADAGNKDAKECHEGSGCNGGVCPWSGDKQGDKKQHEGQEAKPAPATPPSSNQ